MTAQANARRILPRANPAFEQGDTRQGLLSEAMHGRLKVTQVTRDGQQIIVRVVHPGDSARLSPARASAAPIIRHGDGGGGQPRRPPADQSWDGFVEDNPHLAMNAIRTIGQRLDEAHPASARCRRRRSSAASPMLCCGWSSGPASASRRACASTSSISRRDIAEMTGTTLHTVSRILSAREAQGLVEGGRQKLVVCDAAGLTRLAENAE